MKFLPTVKFIETEYEGQTELIANKVKCRQQIFDFVNERETDFDNFRKRVLDTFTRMNVIKSELGAMWQVLEKSKWSDEVVDGIAK